jgi:hypothetical protein
MPGNSLGSRKWYKYEADSGVSYSYLTDVDLGAASGATADASFPNFPKRFKPRVVFIEGVSATGQKLRKMLIVPTNDSTLYSPQTTQVVNIDAIAFSTTGRRGEKVSFPSN